MNNGNSADPRSNDETRNINDMGKRVKEEVVALIPVEAYEGLDTQERLLLKKTNEQYVSYFRSGVLLTIS
jgi:hypothetical protein